jgi:hypothetical protein
MVVIKATAVEATVAVIKAQAAVIKIITATEADTMATAIANGVTITTMAVTTRIVIGCGDLASTAGYGSVN